MKTIVRQRRKSPTRLRFGTMILLTLHDRFANIDFPRKSWRMTTEMECFALWARAIKMNTVHIADKLRVSPQTVNTYISRAKVDSSRFIECGWVMRREDWGTVSWVCRYCLSVFPGDYSSVAVLDAWRHVFDPAAKFDSRSMLERAQ